MSNGKDIKDVVQAFESGSIYSATDSDLKEYLKPLCLTGGFREQDQCTIILRGLTINHIQMANLITKLNRQNTRLTWVVVVLAILSAISTIVSIFI